MLDASVQSGVTIRSSPGERAVLTGIIIVRPSANNIRIANVDIDGGPAGSMNTVKVYSSDFTLEDSSITNGSRGPSCLMLGSSSAGRAIRPVIRRNRFHECGNPANGNLDHAIYASALDNGLITENVFWNTAGYSIQLYPNAQNTTFSHNVIDGSGSNRGGLVFGSESDGTPSSGNIVENNVIAYAATYNIASSWGGTPGTGNIARSNCVFGGANGNIATPVGFISQANVVADPAFVNRAGHDYRLQAGSGCLATVGYDTVARLG